MAYESTIGELGEGREEVSSQFLGALRERRTDEVRRGLTLVGPHRDEISFTIDGRSARDFGSQGQQRSIVLAWKIAEVEVTRDILGRPPLLLLDDVMSELDATRARPSWDSWHRRSKRSLPRRTSGIFRMRCSTAQRSYAWGPSIDEWPRARGRVSPCARAWCGPAEGGADGRVTEKGRLNATAGLGDFINSERSRLFDGATPERRQQFRQAERRHEIYHAWNQVCANSRRG